MKRKDLIYIIIIVLFGSLIYANSLTNSFVFDDKGHIVQNHFIKNWDNIGKLVSKDYFSLTNEGYALSWRPVTTLSYFINYSLWGLNPFGYHLSNLFIHLFNAILVYLISHFIFKNRRVSLLSGLFFVSHPINTEAVSGITFNENLLACLFLLLSFYTYLKIKMANRNWRNVGLLIISNLLYFIALLSKEVAIALPLIIISYDYYCFSDEKKKNHITNRKAFYYLSYVVVTTFYLGIRFVLLKDLQTVFFYRVFENDFLSLGFLKIITNWIHSIRLLIFPVKLCVVPIMHTPGSLFESLSFILIVLTIITGLVGRLIYKYSKKIFWSMLWIILNLSPLLIVIPFYYLFGERYLYIPSIGFCLLLAIGIDKGIQSKKILIVGVIFLLFFYSWKTIKRNNDWKDDFTLWSQTVKKWPDNYHAYNQLGYVYMIKGDYDKAFWACKKALELYPGYVSAWHNLGSIYLLKGEYGEAITVMKKVLKLSPNHILAHNSLGICYGTLGLYNKAMMEYEKILELNPNLPGVYKNIGNLFIMKGLDNEAIKAYEHALRLDPNYKEVKQLLSVNKYKNNDTKEGISYFYNKIKQLDLKILNLMHFELVENQPYLTGEVEKYLMKDNFGDIWLFETYPSYALDVAKIQEAVYYWGLICGIDLPEIHTIYLPINGKLMFGSIQKFLSNVSSFCDLPTDKLSPTQIDYIQKQHVFDWFILNHDCTKDNFLLTNEGNVVGIDKDSAFNIINTPDLNVKPFSKVDDPVSFGYYFYFWEAYVNKEINVNLAKSFDFIDYIQRLDDDFIKEIFNPVFYVYGKYNFSRYERLIERKKNMPDIFKNFYNELTKTKAPKNITHKGNSDEYAKLVLENLKKNIIMKEEVLNKLESHKTGGRQKNINVISSKTGWYTINALRDGYQKRTIDDSQKFISFVEGVIKGLDNLRQESVSVYEKLAISLYLYQVNQSEKEISIEDFEQDAIKHIAWHPDEIDVSALESTMRVSYRKPQKKMNVYKALIEQNPYDFIAHLNYTYRPMEVGDREEKNLEYENKFKKRMNPSLYKIVLGALKETDPHLLRIYMEGITDNVIWKNCLLGMMYKQRDQKEEELEAYKRALLVKNDQGSLSWAYTLLGIYYEYNEYGVRFGNSFTIDLAIDYFKKALEIKPDLLTARLNLLNLYMVQQNVAEVIGQLKAIGEIDPYYANDFPQVFNIIGMEHDYSKKELLEKLKLATLDRDACYIIGLAYQIRGKKDKAKRYLKKSDK